MPTLVRAPTYLSRPISAMPTLVDTYLRAVGLQRIADMRRKHTLHECDKHDCFVCNGGLASCTVCNGAEVTLPLDCPGRPMTTEEQDGISAGTLMFYDGHWYEPAKGRMSEEPITMDSSLFKFSQIKAEHWGAGTALFTLQNMGALARKLKKGEYDVVLTFIAEICKAYLRECGMGTIPEPNYTPPVEIGKPTLPTNDVAPTLAGDGKSHIISVCECSSCVAYRELQDSRAKAEPSRSEVHRFDLEMREHDDTASRTIHLPGLLSAGVAVRSLHPESLQYKVFEWMIGVMGEEVMGNLEERNWRCAEEFCELMQAAGFPYEHLVQMAKHVYAKNVDRQNFVAVELGDLVFCLAALANAHDIDMAQATSFIVERNWKNADKIKAKHNAKRFRSEAKTT